MAALIANIVLIHVRHVTGWLFQSITRITIGVSNVHVTDNQKNVVLKFNFKRFNKKKSGKNQTVRFIHVKI